MSVDYGFNVCRKCMATEGLTSLFEGKAERLKMLEAIGGVDISKDRGKFGAMICGSCSEELEKLCIERWKIKNVERLYLETKRAEKGDMNLVQSETNTESSMSSRYVDTSSDSSTSMTEYEEKLKNPTRNKNQKDFECKICFKNFPGKVNLKQHLDLRHLQRKNFCCDLCGKWYYNKSQICSHIINNHTVRNIKTLDESRPFKCTMCPKRFTAKMYVKEHELYKHSDARPFTCSCGKSFKTQQILNAHQVVHSNKRPWKCHCGKAFKVQGQLKTHQHKIHGMN